MKIQTAYSSSLEYLDFTFWYKYPIYKSPTGIVIIGFYPIEWARRKLQ